MNDKWIKYGIIAAGLANIGGVLLFSRAFSNEVLNQADPVVMSNFGLLMIIVWGLAYISVANVWRHVPWLLALFAVEKLVYGVAWLCWLQQSDLAALYQQDLFAGAFYSIYGPNDFAFMLFFMFAFLKARSS